MVCQSGCSSSDGARRNRRCSPSPSGSPPAPPVISHQATKREAACDGNQSKQSAQDHHVLGSYVRTELDLLSALSRIFLPRSRATPGSRPISSTNLASPSSL